MASRAAPLSRSWRAMERTLASGSAAWAASGSPRRRARSRRYIPRLYRGGRQSRHRRQHDHRDGRHWRLCDGIRSGHRHLRRGTPKDAMNATLEMYEITCAEHNTLPFQRSTFAARRPALTSAKWWKKHHAAHQHRRRHKDPGVGQVGAGLVRPPMTVFEQALVAFAEQYGY